MPAWLLTNTFYGQWLPGDERGSVTSVRDRRPDDQVSDKRIEHDLRGTAPEPPRRGLERASLLRLKHAPISCTVVMAETLFRQFQETATFRKRPLWAVAIMWNHMHMVVHAPDDPAPDRLLGDFKAYGSRALNRACSEQVAARWWTDKGSKRKLGDDADVAAAIHYVTQEQPEPLLVWSLRDGRII
ncbi:MAG: hypothetical protein C0483_19170 [Pirellula sp.]|nr:hypothetical protein [Pirellula sp.]